MKRRNNATRKNEKTKSAARKDDKMTVQFLNGVYSRGVFFFFFFFFFFSRWNFDFSCSGFRYFVFSRGVISSFRMAIFRLFAWRLFACVISRRKDEMAQTSHHNKHPFPAINVYYCIKSCVAWY